MVVVKLGHLTVGMIIHFRAADIGGAGGILSNSNDIAKWLHLHLNKGINQDGNTVVKEAILEETYQPVNTITGKNSISRPEMPVTYSHDTYGLGWKIGYYRGKG